MLLLHPDKFAWKERPSGCKSNILDTWGLNRPTLKVKVRQFYPLLHFHGKQWCLCSVLTTSIIKSSLTLMVYRIFREILFKAVDWSTAGGESETAGDGTDTPEPWRSSEQHLTIMIDLLEFCFQLNGACLIHLSHLNNQGRWVQEPESFVRK